MKKKNFFAQYKQFTFFLILAVVIILIAVFAPVVSGGVDPLKGSLDEALLAPSKAHIFGTDKMGRDIFARVIYGARSVSDSNFWSSCTDFLYRNNTWRDRRIFWRYRGQRDHANR